MFFSPTEIGSLFHLFAPRPHPTGNRELESKVLLDGREWSVCVCVCVCVCVSTNEAIFLTLTSLLQVC